MERINRIPGRKLRRKLVALLVLCAAMPALAEVILLPPGLNGADDESEFPESRFGAAPAHPLTGRIVEKDAPRSRGRAPASGAVAARDVSRSPAGRVEVPVADGNTRAVNYASLVPEKGKGVQEIAVIANDLGFFPKTIFVTRDIPVRMYVTGATKTTLCIMMDSFHVRKQIRSNEVQEISFTPSTAGQFRFYCPVNGMEGNIVVREVSYQQ